MKLLSPRLYALSGPYKARPALRFRFLYLAKAAVLSRVYGLPCGLTFLRETRTAQAVEILPRALFSLEAPHV